VFTYLLLLAINHKKILAQNFKDEFLLFISGITGGTLYFWAENTALTLSPSSNVSLIVCTNPLLIMIFGGLLFKSERLKSRQILGSLLTFVGMVLVVLNGKFILKLSPLGDFLAFVAAILWTIYSLSLKPFKARYSTLFITRKIFFYSIASSIPLMVAEHLQGRFIPWENFAEPVVAFNFLCLAIFSSLLGYVAWNTVLERLGTVLASNYIYAIPLVTIITALVTIGERITPMAWAGAAAIVSGMVIAEYKSRR
jgi:drug/metabolite transporter (DMT)-like permease